MICKVVTSETCHPTEIAKVEELLKTNFTLHNPHNVDPNIIPVVVTAPPPPSPPGKSKEKLKTQEDNKSEASDWEGGREGDKSSAISTSRLSRVRSKGKSRKQSSSGSSSSSRSSSKSSRSSSRSRSRGRKRKHTNSPDAEGKEAFSIFTSEMLAKMKCEENSAYKEHDAAYEVYLDVPEMHPSYEDKYERFLQSYKKKYNTTDESEHMTKMWHKYWKLCIESIKGKDWKRKKRDLLEKYRLQARAAKSEKTLTHFSHSSNEGQSSLLASSGMIPPMSSAEVVMAITEISSRPLKDFSVSGTLDLMEVLSDKIGDVGSSLKMIVNGVRFFGLKTKKGMDLIAQEDNILTMNIVFERLLNLGRTVASEERNFFEKVIAWGIHLIKHAKNFKEPESLDITKSSSQSSNKAPKQSVRFDLNLFAQQTYNQDPNWIYKTLEESLEYVYGAKPDTDIVKQMYANIGAIHLNMSASTPFLMGGSTVSGISNNPGIVSHGDQASSASSFANIPLTPMTPHSFSSSSYQTPVMSYSSSDQTKHLTDTTSSLKMSQPPLPHSSPQLTSHLDKNSNIPRTEFSSQSFSNPPAPDSMTLSISTSFANPPPPPPPPDSDPPPPPPPPEESASLQNQFMSYSSLQSQSSPADAASAAAHDSQSSNMIDAILNMAKQGTFRK